MTATILNGRTLSTTLKDELRVEVQRYIAAVGWAPGLAIVRVEGDAASGVYSKAILRIANDIGVQTRVEALPSTTTIEELRTTLLTLNEERSVHGIIVQMPLPTHLPQQVVAETIAVAKDIDGISPLSIGNLSLGFPGFVPSTAAAVIEMLKRNQVQLIGQHVVILGRSNVVGKPLVQLFLRENATVTICHSRTTHLADVTRQADILVAAVGQTQMVKADMVRPGATVVDVGINALPEGGIVGDVDFASIQEIAGAITPVPGGIGPLTNAMLMKQCLQAAWWQSARR
jgi:methylenetetrahydrofolate dehydrogenase (NADP+)/methenyltetrahydrofolate cyclohydrolase